MMRKRILIIEDEFLVALDIEDALNAKGFDVSGIADTVDAALSAVSAGGIDAALLDGNLNGCSVGDIAAALSGQGIPFLFVSGYGRETLPTGFDHIRLVAKPFDPSSLVNELHRLLD